MHDEQRGERRHRPTHPAAGSTFAGRASNAESFFRAGQVGHAGPRGPARGGGWARGFVRTATSSSSPRLGSGRPRPASAAKATATATSVPGTERDLPLSFDPRGKKIVISAAGGDRLELP